MWGCTLESQSRGLGQKVCFKAVSAQGSTASHDARSSLSEGLMGLLCTLGSDAWRVAGESDGIEDGLDGVGLCDEGNSLHLTVAARALEHIHVEHPAHELCPFDSMGAWPRAWIYVGAVVLWFGLGDNP